MLAQDYPVREVIVVDDASIDDLETTLSPYLSDVTVLRLEANGGAAEARNTGIRAASSPLVAFLDADDRWEPTKLTRQLQQMRRLRAKISCTGAVTVFGANELPRSDVRPFPEIIGLDQFVWGCHVAPGTTMVAERSLLLEMSGYDRRFARFEDWDLLLRASLARVRIAYLREPLATVIDSGAPAQSAVAASLEALRGQHRPDLEGLGRDWVRRFEAAVAFEEAVSAWAHGRRVATMRSLLRSVLLCPRGHLPLRIVFLPRLQREISRLRRRPLAGREDE